MKYGGASNVRSAHRALDFPKPVSPLQAIHRRLGCQIYSRVSQSWYELPGGEMCKLWTLHHPDDVHFLPGLQRIARTLVGSTSTIIPQGILTPALNGANRNTRNSTR